jgi:hypothetical protein
MDLPSGEHQSSIVADLLKHGANPSQVDRSNQSAADIAAQKGIDLHTIASKAPSSSTSAATTASSSSPAPSTTGLTASSTGGTGAAAAAARRRKAAAEAEAESTPAAPATSTPPVVTTPMVTTEKKDEKLDPAQAKKSAETMIQRLHRLFSTGAENPRIASELINLLKPTYNQQLVCSFALSIYRLLCCRIDV